MVGGVLDSLAEGLRTFVAGCTAYLIGGYIRKYEPLKKVKSWALLLSIIVMYGFIFLSHYNVTINSIQDYLESDSSDLFLQRITSYPTSSTICLFYAVILFELFRRIRIPQIKIINRMASAVFMIYLFHGSGFIMSIHKSIDWISILHNNKLMFITYLFGLALVFFIIGYIIYESYVLFGKICGKYKHLIINSENRTQL